MSHAHRHLIRCRATRLGWRPIVIYASRSWLRKYRNAMAIPKRWRKKEARRQYAKKLRAAQAAQMADATTYMGIPIIYSQTIG